MLSSPFPFLYEKTLNHNKVERFFEYRVVLFPHLTVSLFQHTMYGAQNEAYRMMEGRKVGKVVSLQRVIRSLMVEAPQNETFTLV
nr:MAG TPA: hypothetical protein [Caudoviricetes sp.]